MLESHAHCHNTWTDASIVRHPVTDHSACCRIDDQPDITFYTTDFDVGFITDHGRAFFVRVRINKRFDADGGALTVVGNHLVRYGDSVDVLHGLCTLAKREAEIDPVGKAQGHDISVVFAEFQRGGILRQGGNVHLEEIYRKLTVDIVELIFVFTVVLVQICLINLFQVMKIVRAFWIHAFVDDKVLTVFLPGQRMGTIGTLEREDLGKMVFLR